MSMIDYDNKLQENERLIVLAPIDDKLPLNSFGSVDPRLLKGENNLRAIKEEDTSFWYLKYKSGDLPGALKCKFTSFNMLKKFTEDYFKKRNIKIVEIKN